MLHHHLIGVLHFGQCEGGETIDSPRGTRQTTTFRNEPINAPRANENTAKTLMTKGSRIIRF
jgi:hypothetical protein